MVTVITVEREYGSQGAEFARHLAHRLGWKLVDHCLVEEIAQKAGVPKSVVENCDERLDPWYHRITRSLWYGSAERPPTPSEEVFDSESLVGLVRDYLKRTAAEGRCVIVGRGAACALAGSPGVFHLFVHASTTRKIRWFEEHFPEQAAEAQRALEATDTRRAIYIRRYYDRDWADHRLYHMMINSCVGFEAMIHATLGATDLAAHPPTA